MRFTVHLQPRRAGDSARVCGGAAIVNALLLDGPEVQVLDAAGRSIPGDRWLGARNVHLTFRGGRVAAGQFEGWRRCFSERGGVERLWIRQLDGGLLVRGFLLRSVRPFKFVGPHLPAQGTDVEIEEIVLDADSMDGDGSSDSRDRDGRDP